MAATVESRVSWPFANWRQQKYENLQQEKVAQKVGQQRGRRGGGEEKVSLPARCAAIASAFCRAKKKNYFYMFDTHATATEADNDEGDGDVRHVACGVGGN